MSYCPLDQVESFLRRFVVYPSEHALKVHTLWIAHCHLMDLWESTPRLAFMSPEPESGKTRALEVTALFVPTPRLSFSMSAASLVRIIAKGHETGAIPTILFDEIDNLFSKSEEGISDLRGALNAGYRRGAVATRCINKGDGIADFLCFSPLAVAGLRTLPDALATRSIFIHMRPRAHDEAKESFRIRYHPGEAEPIKHGLIEWCEEIAPRLMGYEPRMPDSITDRTADIYEPLLSIADMAGGHWPREAREAAVYLTGAARDDVTSAGRELLAHCKDAFLEFDRIWASELCRRLRDREESPWADVKGKPIDERGLALRLKPYRIKSRDVKLEGINRKGYFREDFHDAWKRYPEPSATSATSATKLMNNNKKVAEVAEVALREEKPPEPEPERVCQSEGCGASYEGGLPADWAGFTQACGMPISSWCPAHKYSMWDALREADPKGYAAARAEIEAAAAPAESDATDDTAAPPEPGLDANGYPILPDCLDRRRRPADGDPFESLKDPSRPLQPRRAAE